VADSEAAKKEMLKILQEKTQKIDGKTNQISEM
jgi:hypothetical protein